MRRVKTNKTQILHRIRLNNFVPKTPLEDQYSEEKLQPDDEKIVPQDDLYTITREDDFDYQVFEPRQDDNPNGAAQAPDNNATSATSDYVIYVNADDNAVRPRPAISRDGILSRNANDVTEGNDRSNMNEHEVTPRAATSRDHLILHDEDDIKERPNTATSRDNRNIGNMPIDS